MPVRLDLFGLAFLTSLHRRCCRFSRVSTGRHTLQDHDEVNKQVSLQRQGAAKRSTFLFIATLANPSLTVHSNLDSRTVLFCAYRDAVCFFPTNHPPSRFPIDATPF